MFNIILNDQYSPPRMYKLKITVEDPLKSRSGNETIGGNQTGSFEVIKAHLQIESISKDGMVTLKFKATRGGDELSKLIRIEDLEIWTEVKDVKQVVRASISSKDPSKSLVKLRLQF